jgi:NAD(P)-dependent dehydrogenase (short-subunit alcohol dehydrogenase family)
VLESVSAVRESARRETMLGRFGQPEDIAWGAVYLASEEASWINRGGLVGRWRGYRLVK